MRLLAAARLSVPAWVATNHLESVEAFLATCPQGAVYKACSGLRSRVRMVDKTVKNRLRTGTTPVVIQAYIPGHDVRLHLVDGRPFASAVESTGVDYRFDGVGNRFRAISTPDDVVDRCRRVTIDEGLLIAGFDFRVTADGEWYCLEVNPVPSFLPYEMATGQAIGDSLLDVLAAGRRSEAT